jgi:hypothetical protein
MSGENLSEVMPLAWARAMVRRDVKVRDLDLDLDFAVAVAVAVSAGGTPSGE